MRTLPGLVFVAVGSESRHCWTVRMQQSMAEKEVKIVILGEAGVGKSALAVRLMTGRFLHRYNPTLEDEYCRAVEMDGHHYQLRIFDTAGQEQSHVQYYFAVADVLVLAFSLTDRSSLEAAKELRRFADSCCDQHSRLPAVLVGTKLDLEEERTISYEEGAAAAKELGCNYKETSAATNSNVLQAFQMAVRLTALQRRSTVDLSVCGCSLGLEKKLHRSAKKSVKGLVSKCTHFLNKRKSLHYSEHFAIVE